MNTVTVYDSVADYVAADTIPRSTAPTPMIYFNSASTSPSEVTHWNQGQMLAKYMDVGLRFDAPDLGTTWGSRDDIIEDLIADVLVPAGKTGKPVLTGMSHGGICALHYAAHHPTKVAAIALVLPLVHLTFAYDMNLLGYQADIAAKWGVTAPNPLPVGADPSTMLDQLEGIPIRLYISSTDTISAGADAYGALDSVEVIVVGDGAHGEESLVEVDWDDMALWLTSHAKY